MSDSISVYLVLSAFLLCTGIYGMLSRRNVIAVLISLELILNAANINFLAIDRFIMTDDAVGTVFSLFVIGLAAAEICVALSIAILLIRRGHDLSLEKIKELEG